MGWWGVVFAIGLLWLVGAFWLRVFWTESRSGIWPTILGYAYLLAFLAVAALLRATAALGLPFFVVAPLVAIGIAVAILIGLCRLAVVRGGFPSFKPPRPSWMHLPVAILLIWMLVRALDLALELWWQPLFPWDAWTTWLLRTRVWAELGHWVPFISSSEWLADPSAQAQTIAAWHYPATVSLFGLWSTLGYGEWNEVAAKMPWLGCLLALVLGFYGQARLWGASSLTALGFLWILVTLPLFDSHVALAGYADIWLSSLLFLAFAAVLHWVRDGDGMQAVLALICVCALPFIKLEGAIWLLLFLPAVLAAKLPWRWMFLTLAVFGLAISATWLFGGWVMDSPFGRIELGPDLIQLPLVGRFELVYHDNWAALWRNLFLYDNWHLLFYGLVFMLGWALWRSARRPVESWERSALVFVLSALFALFVLFFWTGAYRWAEDSTSVARLFMHFIPAFIFWAMLLWTASGAGMYPQRADEAGDASMSRRGSGDRVRLSPN